VDIFRFYLNIIPARGMFNSPFRKDINPSCCFYNRRNIVYMYDHATGRSYDCFNVVEQVYNIKNFKEVLSRIYHDTEDINKMPTIQTESLENQPYYNKEKGVTFKPTKLKIETRDYRDYDLEYWNRFGISERTLKKYDVYPVLRSYLNESILYTKEDYEDPCYAYYFKDSDTLKLYRPFNKKYKWLSNVSHQELQGAQHVRYTMDLIITKSLKDVMTLSEAGLNAVAVQSETSLFPDALIEIIAQVKSYGHNVVILYDNDRPGIEAAQQKAEQYKLPAIFIPKESNAKDASDFVAIHGMLALQNLFKSA